MVKSWKKWGKVDKSGEEWRKVVKSWKKLEKVRKGGANW